MSTSSLKDMCQTQEPSSSLVSEEAKVIGGDLVTFALMFAQAPSPATHESPNKVSTPFPAIPSLIGKILMNLFKYSNHIVITPITELLAIGDQGVLFLDELSTPNIKKALGKGCKIEQTTLAFVSEIRIFHAACLIVSLDIKTILKPFEGQLLISPTNGQLSMESLVFDPHYYGFRAVVGFFMQTSDRYFVKVIICFILREEEKGAQVEHKFFVAGWVHQDHIILHDEDRRYLEMNSLILDIPTIMVEPSSSHYKVHIFY
ncbi:hypothetical protein BDN71DRAFT_1428413 [Pleurotus eryngii]|uniref:Uncharacterized protein n=1 Tax=Pleurotus eryngii TaxID=5323 RepID=A0A9P6DAB3_PLEER|nr:hypothetical protein BDN71DRAFT_1428413 [Pleurotus eryngii]